MSLFILADMVHMQSFPALLSERENGLVWFILTGKISCSPYTNSLVDILHRSGIIVFFSSVQVHAPGSAVYGNWSNNLTYYLGAIR